MKKLIIIAVVAAVVLFGVRLGLVWATWASCTGDGARSFVQTVEHLGPPSTVDCSAEALARPAPTTEPPTTCEGYRERDHADYTCDGTYFAAGSAIPDDVPEYLRPPDSGPCPLGYPPASHFMCTTPTIPPDQWPHDSP
jgi:hypothetical protein